MARKRKSSGTHKGRAHKRRRRNRVSHKRFRRFHGFKSRSYKKSGRTRAGIRHHGEALVGGFNRGGVLPHGWNNRLYYFDEEVSTSRALATGLTLWTIRPDGMFDPDVAVGGHQPRGYDQWAAMYALYRVKKCRARLSFTVQAATEGVEGVIYLRAIVRGTNSIPGVNDSLEDIFERRQDLVKRVNVRSDTATNCVITLDVNPLELVRAVSSRYDINSGFSAVTANPTYESGALPHIAFQILQAANQDLVVIFTSQLFLEFDAEWKRPNALGSS